MHARARQATKQKQLKIIMQRYSLASLVKIGLCALLALGTVVQIKAEDTKVNAVGSWTWTGAGRNGNPGRPQTIKLKMEADKLVGTISGGGRGRAAADGTAAAAPRETKLEDVKLAGDQLTFKVTRAGRNGGNPMVQKFAGKVNGDTIKGKIEVEVEGQDPRTTEWEAKRDTEKKEAAATDAK